MGRGTTINQDEIPYRWEQVSFKKFIELQKHSNEDDSVRHISILLDKDYDFIKKAKIENLEFILRRLSFVNQPPQWVDYPSKIGGLELPKDITWETTEQFEAMRKLMVPGETDPVKINQRYSEIVAIYYQPAKDKGEYNSDRAKELIPEIENLSCVEVVSLGYFFASKLLATSNNIPQTYLHLSTLMKKQRPGYQNLIRNLSSMVRSMFSRKVTSFGKEPYLK